ncbi:hypothetical protein HERIO_1348 [Hepatospora eriocheir]|uniref:Uncharacterized protein n=1 Tax=Hepatospora eriocheir TaxID=1081669 RepID=A0A1X0QAD9_9MICR|nr:hypothetical protein HERIO_1348 [Hepatospora eriocheir]
MFILILYYILLISFKSPCLLFHKFLRMFYTRIFIKDEVNKNIINKNDHELENSSTTIKKSNLDDKNINLKEEINKIE